MKEDPLYELLDTRFTTEMLREAYPPVVATELMAFKAPGWQALQDLNASKEQLVSAIVAALRVIEERYAPDSKLTKV